MRSRSQYRAPAVSEGPEVVPDHPRVGVTGGTALANVHASHRAGKTLAGATGMISIDRLLDGLDVEVESLLVHHDVQCTPSGGGRVRLAGSATVCISTHAVVVLPPPHRRSAPAQGIEAVSGEARTLVASGCIRATYQGTVSLFDDLREPLVEQLTVGDPITRVVEELLDEMTAGRPGCRAMVEALLRRCLILLLRRCYARGACSAGWLAALEDARLGRAVAAMQSRPEQSFTLPELAEVAGMSRSVFAARFVMAMGESPIGFLKRLRLARAAQLLTRGDLPVKTVAAQVGYASRSAFTRAFVARHGVQPTAFRAAACNRTRVAPIRGGQRTISS
jgi:AraC-like DNA-binding protein